MNNTFSYDTAGIYKDGKFHIRIFIPKEGNALLLHYWEPYGSVTEGHTSPFRNRPLIVLGYEFVRPINKYYEAAHKVLAKRFEHI
jgi:hypothetical protein